MEKMDSKEKIFWLIAIAIGILITMFTVGCCINWYSGWNLQSSGDILMAIPGIIFLGLLLDGLIWILIFGIIIGLFFNDSI